MILIADSGSTKTDWCLTNKGGEPKFISTKGINPFYQTEEEILTELSQTLVPEVNKVLKDTGSTISDVYFYGAGCTVEKSPIVKSAVLKALGAGVNVEVQSDMVGAARALWSA
jgi:N-acetylglucosamine kinase-like BadF-type ATPase